MVRPEQSFFLGDYQERYRISTEIRQGDLAWRLKTDKTIFEMYKVAAYSGRCKVVDFTELQDL